MGHPRGGKEVLMDAEANGKIMLSSMVHYKDMNSANVSHFGLASHSSQYSLEKAVQH